MHKRTKALMISKAVKESVFERDGGCCVWCGKPGLPEAHFIPRSRGGLGIEQNILTLCRECHEKFDHGTNRNSMRDFFETYLKSKYEDWDAQKLYYKKSEF